MVHVPQFIRQEENDDQSVEYVHFKLMVSSAEEDIKPLLRVSHIPRYHYADCMFDIFFLMWTKIFAFVWSTYGGMRELNIVGPFHGEDGQPTTVFTTAIGKMNTMFSMEFYKSLFVGS